MKKIFSTSDFRNQELAENYDELPLWSAPFGIRLLEAIDYSKPVEALDIGCGTGFPLLELAQRFGNQSHFTGVDPWQEGLNRIRSKAKFYQIDNIDLVCASAELLPFDDESITLITSNNGINNVTSISHILSECYRVAKKGAEFIFTANLPGTMSTFYEAFRTILQESGLNNCIYDVDKHIENKRKSTEEMNQLIKNEGFRVISTNVFSFQLGFASGSAFLNHFLSRLYFLETWLSLIPEDSKQVVMNNVEKKLNQIAKSSNGLFMDIPFCVYKAIREG